MPSVDSTHSLAVTVERIALVMRYVVSALLAPVFLFGYFGNDTSDFVVISTMIVVHNAVVHGVLWSRKYRFFHSRLNFAIYLLQITTVVAITGADSSDAYILYFLLIIGFTAYDRRQFMVMRACLLCVAMYISVICYENFADTVTVPLGVLLVRIISIVLVGWMVAALSERLRRAEISAIEQAGQVMAAESTLRAILNSAGDPILVIDENEYITECNDRAVEFLAVPRANLIGQRFRTYLFDDGTLPQKVADLRARGQTESAQIIVTSEGDERDVHLIARSYVRDGARYFVVLLRDETSRKQYDESARVAALRVERLNTELRQLDKHKADFIQTIAVHLRAPLSAVSGYVDMLLNEELGDVNPDQRRALQTCRRSLIRAFRLIEQTIQAYTLRHSPPQGDVTKDRDLVKSNSTDES
ncbi:MAG TPA: PAS domain-containing protein [Candidatus Hydrogenedentes bacterium]|nr:PAS domain-containing protein [Candidatus Hydrogenedentota bacterium]